MERTANDDWPAKALVAMSGGVDSSVAALTLVEKGVDITGVTFRLPVYGAEEETGKSCCGPGAIEDARRVCLRLGIKHYVLDYRERFERTVIENFCREYRDGRTPNPCIRCNDWLKFGLLLKTASAMDIHTVATGHYARRRYNGESERYELLTGLEGEDQSYFLFPLSQNQLAHASFPIGNRTKEEVREKALEAGLRTHDKPKSQDLCFLPGGRYGDLIGKKHPELLVSGEIRHVSGEIIGQHKGIAFYTIGQRKGLGIAWNEPLYVVELDPENNRITAGEKKHAMKKEISVGELNWVSIAPPTDGPLRADVKIRFLHPGAPATLYRCGDERAWVQFDRAQMAPAPGQAAVFYDKHRVLGGGFIEQDTDRRKN